VAKYFLVDQGGVDRRDGGGEPGIRGVDARHARFGVRAGNRFTNLFEAPHNSDEIDAQTIPEQLAHTLVPRRSTGPVGGSDKQLCQFVFLFYYLVFFLRC
jgi:hypothetical protein